MVRMRLLAAAIMAAIAAIPALASDYLEYPAPIPHYPFQRSHRTGQVVVIPPYRVPFVVRVFTTPPQPPYYNVPPYAVVAPY